MPRHHPKFHFNKFAILTPTLNSNLSSMPFYPSLVALAKALSGEFDNREQAIANPTWFVHLRLWQRPVPLFAAEGSLTLFAEQANALYPNNPYRQRILRLMLPEGNSPATLQVQYYSFADPSAVSGAGQDPERLRAIMLDQISLLPGCVLMVNQPQPTEFSASPPPGSACFFSYQGEARQVSLGFEVRNGEFFSYDKGIDPQTGSAIWGAIMGPYQFKKQQDYSQELPTAALFN
jgi:hypothetical protein